MQRCRALHSQFVEVPERNVTSFGGRRGKVSVRVKGGMVKPLVCWVHVRIGLGSFVAWPARGFFIVSAW